MDKEKLLNKLLTQLNLEDFYPDIDMDYVIKHLDENFDTIFKVNFLSLTEREIKILKARFGLCGEQHKTLAELANLFNVNSERIRQIEAKILRKIKSNERARFLLAFGKELADEEDEDDDEILIKDVLTLSTRAEHCLKKAKILTIDDLMCLTKEDLLKVWNLGIKTLEEIDSALDEWLGYHFERKKNLNSEDYIDITNTMNNGMEATIIAYRSVGDIDVQFEDGVVVEEQYMRDFKKGNVTHPNKYIGITKIMRNRMKATIIACEIGRYTEVDVQFEDGTIVKRIRIKNFEMGDVEHPKEFIGKTKTLNNSQKGHKIDFETGNVEHPKEFIGKTKTLNNSQKGHKIDFETVTINVALIIFILFSLFCIITMFIYVLKKDF